VFFIALLIQSGWPSFLSCLHSFASDTIPGAEAAYDALLLLLVFSIFLLFLLRYYLELRARDKVYKRYIDAAKGPNDDLEDGRQMSRFDSSWLYWSAAVAAAEEKEQEEEGESRRFALVLHR
jgi:hypothetical protein